MNEVNLELLLQRNAAFAECYDASPLMQLIKSSDMARPESRASLLDCIQVFSDYFQKAVMSRYLLCDNPKFLAVAQEHLQEEFGHNVSLHTDRNYREAPWDAILDATAGWFTWKMFTLDQEEKTVLMHLVLEASANIFFRAAHHVMHAYGETEYFKIHAEADEKHEQMGRELLKSLTDEKYKSLLKIQEQGWDMLNAVCDRIAILVEFRKG